MGGRVCRDNMIWPYWVSFVRNPLYNIYYHTILRNLCMRYGIPWHGMTFDSKIDDIVFVKAKIDVNVPSQKTPRRYRVSTASTPLTKALTTHADAIIIESTSERINQKRINHRIMPYVRRVANPRDPAAHGASVDRQQPCTGPLSIDNGDHAVSIDSNNNNNNNIPGYINSLLIINNFFRFSLRRVYYGSVDPERRSPLASVRLSVCLRSFLSLRPCARLSVRPSRPAYADKPDRSQRNASVKISLPIWMVSFIIHISIVNTRRSYDLYDRRIKR